MGDTQKSEFLPVIYKIQDAGDSACRRLEKSIKVWADALVHNDEGTASSMENYCRDVLSGLFARGEELQRERSKIEDK